MKFPFPQLVKKRFPWNIISHPVVLAIGATLLVLLIFPLNLPKYKAEITDKRKIPIPEVMIWDDLENDGSSDRIFTYNNTVGTTALTIDLYPSMNTVEWDLRGIVPENRNEFLTTGDYDGDGKKEVYVFTISNDSILLHIISDFRNPRPALTNRFIAKVGLLNGKSDAEIISARMEDLNGDGNKELIFGITTGFSIYPRNIYAYDIAHDFLLSSPKSGFQLQEILQEDISGDDKSEILLDGYAPGNTGLNYPYNDSSCWLMVFNRKLQFGFDPIEFPGVHGGIFQVGMPKKDGHSSLWVLWCPPHNLMKNIRLFRVDCPGKVTAERDMVEFPREFIISKPFIVRNGENVNVAIPVENHGIYLFDTAFRLVRKIDPGISISSPTFMDIDLDGSDEMLAQSTGLTQFAIFRHDFRYPVILDLGLSDGRKTRISLITEKGSSPKIFIDSGDMQYTLAYDLNPQYAFKWIFYSLIYFSILLFTLLVSKIQKNRMLKRYKTEKKINELQLKIVRNQMDPHFTMNAINSVIAAVNRNEKEKATANLYHFSLLYRSLVLSADKISRPLQEEIGFTENYLALEKFRFDGHFNYTISIDPSVNPEWMIPKMVIQSPVENAVKHGLLGKTEGGTLKIHASTDDGHLVLVIEDNGIGRKKAMQTDQHSTGKGLQIMDQFLDLYHKITGLIVHSRIIDLYTANGEPAGTRVIIHIPVSSKT
jgi:hypothetical protein